MKMKNVKMLAGFLAATMCAGLFAPATVRAEGFTGWKEENGNKYWYEDDVKQGTEGRGKEIYDPSSDAWYWLDAPDGIMAKSKDVYQESDAGAWADRADGTGKWVRYDENGHMIKGWSGDYYFDLQFGTMAKGYATIEGKEYYFNPATGVKEQEIGEVPETGWKNIDGNDYWYEGYVRQGYSVDAGYRGKEIYDPASDAWYWLDNVDGGKKAVSKDVYQESEAGEWGDYVGQDGKLYGKWVRYDEEGHMIKGWSGDYYFDPVYGTMAKGYATIDGKLYHFDETTGVCKGEVQQGDYSWRYTGYTDYYGDGTVESRYAREYDENNNLVKTVRYEGNKTREVKEENYTSYEYYSEKAEDLLAAYEKDCTYDDNGNRTAETVKHYYLDYSQVDGAVRKSYLWSETAYTLKNGAYATAIGKVYGENGEVIAKSETTFNENGDFLTDVRYVINEESDFVKYATTTYEYDGNGAVTRYFYAAETSGDTYETRYENDEKGNVLKATFYSKGEAQSETVYTYEDEKLKTMEWKDLLNDYVSGRAEYDYDAKGNCVEVRRYNASRNTINGITSYELKLSGRTKYEYDKNGNEVKVEYYTISYNFSSNSFVEYQTGYAVSEYEQPQGYQNAIKTAYDRYSGHYVIDEATGEYKFSYNEGDNWAYSSGYKYVYENGWRTKYYSFTKDKNYQKVIDSYTEYTPNNLVKPEEAGLVANFKCAVTYDKDTADKKVIGYSVESYESYRR